MLSFDGRIGRLHFFVASLLIATAASLCLFFLNDTLSTQLIILIYFLIWIIQLNFQVRRLHDLNKTGWWSLVNIVPYINILLNLSLIFKKGDEGKNFYGDSPLLNSGKNIDNYPNEDQGLNHFFIFAISIIYLYLYYDISFSPLIHFVDFFNGYLTFNDLIVLQLYGAILFIPLTLIILFNFIFTHVNITSYLKQSIIVYFVLWLILVGINQQYAQEINFMHQATSLVAIYGSLGSIILAHLITYVFHLSYYKQRLTINS